jgi:hypothetical protein
VAREAALVQRFYEKRTKITGESEEQDGLQQRK